MTGIPSPTDQFSVCQSNTLVCSLLTCQTTCHSQVLFFLALYRTIIDSTLSLPWAVCDRYFLLFFYSYLPRTQHSNTSSFFYEWVG